MKPAIWSPNAIVSIQHIYDYIYKQSPQNASLVIKILFDLGDKLTVFPEKNPIEPLFISNDIRFSPKWNFKIVYRIESIFLIFFQHSKTLKPTIYNN